MKNLKHLVREGFLWKEFSMWKESTTLREMSEKESDSGGIYGMHDEFDDENLYLVVSSRSESDEDIEAHYSQN